MQNLAQTDIASLLNSCQCIDPKHLVVKRVTSSGLVCEKPCWLYWFGLGYEKLTEWVLLDSVEDPEHNWEDDVNSYDGLLSTYAYTVIQTMGWSSPLYLWPLTTDWLKSVRWYLDIDVQWIRAMEVWVSVLPDEYRIFNGQPLSGVWQSADMPFICRPNEVWFWLFNTHFTTTKPAKVRELRFSKVLSSLLLLRNGFNNQAKTLIDTGTLSKDSSDCSLKRPIFFNKGLYASMSPTTTYAELVYLPSP